MEQLSLFSEEELERVTKPLVSEEEKELYNSKIRKDYLIVHNKNIGINVPEMLLNTLYEWNHMPLEYHALELYRAANKFVHRDVSSSINNTLTKFNKEKELSRFGEKQYSLLEEYVTELTKGF